MTTKDPTPEQITALTNHLADAIYGTHADAVMGALLAPGAQAAATVFGCDEDQYRALEIGAENLLRIHGPALLDTLNGSA